MHFNKTIDTHKKTSTQHYLESKYILDCYNFYVEDNINPQHHLFDEYDLNQFNYFKSLVNLSEEVPDFVHTKQSDQLLQKIAFLKPAIEELVDLVKKHLKTVSNKKSFFLTQTDIDRVCSKHNIHANKTLIERYFKYCSETVFEYYLEDLSIADCYTTRNGQQMAIMYETREKLVTPKTK